MRIAIDYTAAARQRAGIGRYTRGLIHALAEVDHENQYALLIPRDGAEDYAWGANFRVVRAPLSEKHLVILWQRARVPLGVEWFVGAHDVFYSPDFVLPPTRAKKMLTVHDLSFVRVPECHHPANIKYLNAAVPRSVARADVILADSDSTRRDLIEAFGVASEKIHTLYSGVEAFFQPIRDEHELNRVRAAYGLSKPFIFGVGTSEPRKNYMRLIEAYARIRQRRDFGLLIAGGKGWLYDEVYQKAAQVSGVRLLGFVPDADLPALYSLATLVVYPSLYEGFGLPVLEAMACGAAVITSNNSSLPEVAGDAALLVDPRDGDALVGVMERALDDADLRAGLSRKALVQASKFSWEQSARELKKTMKSLTM
jgi:glycosyltransferase involved in cell wall biosynthesis